MATLTVTITAGAGAHPGERLRKMAKQIEKAASVVPDSVSTGASVVLTIDNSDPSVQITAGPYQNTAKLWF